jgi:hypothetical protein
MRDPVIDKEGNTYDRAAIEAWLDSGNTASPLTYTPMRKADLTANRALRDTIEAYVEERGGFENIPQIPATSAALPAMIRWQDSPLARAKTVRAVALKISVSALSPEQVRPAPPSPRCLRRNRLHTQQTIRHRVGERASAPPAQVEEVAQAFGAVLLRDPARWHPELDAPQPLRAAAQRARWAADSRFRLRVYGEFAQWLRPHLEFGQLGLLDPQARRAAPRRARA